MTPPKAMLLRGVGGVRQPLTTVKPTGARRRHDPRARIAEAVRVVARCDGWIETDLMRADEVR